MIKQAKIIKTDPYLKPFQDTIHRRMNQLKAKEKELCETNLLNFANGHHYYGLHKTNEKWIFREWAPNATKMFLIGNFCNWKRQNEFEFKKLTNGNFELILDAHLLKHQDIYKLSVSWKGGSGERIPVWANRAVQDEDTKLFSAQIWHPSTPYQWKHDKHKTEITHPLIYEAHVGMASEEEKVGSFNEFRKNVLPRIKKAGYNVIQLMAIQEHPYYGSFGYHVSNLFAVSSRFGTPDELKQLIDAAHEAGIMVIMDLVHSHAVKNELEGLGLFDGSPHQFFHNNERREHVAWDSLCYNYEKNEVLHLLLSNLKYWMEEYHFDGFRFDGVTSMLYYDHGLSRNFTNYHMYFDGQQDEDAICYLGLANKLIKEIQPHSISIAEEMSGYPGLATPAEMGGIGFDYRLAMGIPDYWIRLIKEEPDENWKVGSIFHELSNKRAEEKTISYAESHDQALVGDKTIIFRLIDKEMYWGMGKKNQNLLVDRGIALHKLIRLMTFCCAGNGYLNFMGNEFGHPEWIDFPREGNNWSYKNARRQWSLVDNPNLRFEQLNAFDREMIALQHKENVLNDVHVKCLAANEQDQVLAIQRENLIFVFNVNPNQSFTFYGIPVNSGKYEMILNSDLPKFGGFNRVNSQQIYYSKPDAQMSNNHKLYLYIPSRVALVLKHMPTKSIF